MLEVIFVGTTGSIPTTERGMPAIAVKYESELMLWDCGEGTQRQLMKYHVGYGSINSICITHPHLDHFLGLYGLLETMKLSSVSPRKLSVFLPFKIEDESRKSYGFVDFKSLKRGVLYKGKGFEVSAFPVKHCRGSHGLVFQEEDRRKFHEKKAHSLGLKGRMFREIIEKGHVKSNGKKIKLDEVTWVKPGRKIVYSGDGMVGDSTIKAAKGAELLVHEGTFDSSMDDEAKARRHSTVADAARAAKKSGVKKLIITHVSPRYSDEIDRLLKEAREIFKETEIASDGMRIKL